MSVRDLHKVGERNQSNLTFIKVICKRKHCYKPFEKLRKATFGSIIYVCPSVRMQQLGSHRRIFVKFGILVFFFENVSRIRNFH